MGQQTTKAQSKLGEECNFGKPKERKDQLIGHVIRHEGLLRDILGAQT